MIFHWLTDEGKNNGTAALTFGSSLKGLSKQSMRPDYVTIDRAEIEAQTMGNGTMTEKQLLMYFKQVSNSLNIGGKLYIQATV